MPSDRKTPEEKLAWAKELKERGNASFRAQAIENASLLYADVFEILQQDFLFPPEIKVCFCSSKRRRRRKEEEEKGR